ncbi:MAG: ATP-binding protein, partial [Acetobacteraceae bacterium]
MAIYWGTALALLYNDEWRPIPGEKHPAALGRPGREVWPEIWTTIGPLFEHVQLTGEGIRQRDQLLPMHRHGYTEECYFDFTFSPIRGEDGSVVGIFNAVVETTFRVIEERRARQLQELAARLRGKRSIETTCQSAAAALEDAAADVPFVLFYLLDRGRARLAARAGASLPCTLCPDVFELNDTGAVWARRSQGDRDDLQLVGSLRARAGCDVQGTAWPEPIDQAVLVPLRSPQSPPVGLLIAGLSPRHALDPGYRSYLTRIAGQLSTAIQDAEAYETERRRAEALAEIDRAKTAFFSNVSHEFRTPLTLIMGPLEEAVASPETPPPLRDQLELAHRNSLRLQKLVNGLLDFSQIEAGRMQASYEPTDLAALTADLASTFRSAMERAGLQFEVDCPPLGEPVHVDQEMWEKIVLNLLSNTLKFTFHGTITVRLRRERDCAVLEVSDTGVGVPESELPRLFERFHRVEGTAARTQEGSGIGLALVQELVKLHGGGVEAASKIGSGTTFSIRIPLGIAHLPADRIKAPRSLTSTAVGAQPFVQEALRWIPSSSGEVTSPMPALFTGQAFTARDQRFANTAGARIVFSDDNADMRAYIRDLLSPMYAVESVVDGQEALEAARRERPDLIISDVMMPRLDGLSLLKALRADESLRDVPVILLSARAGEEARVEGLDAGADDYLVKPFFARELLARVGALLELTRMRRENEERFREREEQLRLATEAAEVGLWDVDTVTDTLFWPPRVKEMFGILPDVPVTMADFYAGLHPDDRERTIEAFAAAADPERRALYDIEYRTIGKEDGRIRWVAAKGRGIFDYSGRCIRVIGTAIDISARKRMEAHLASLAREREQLLEAERAARAEAESANHLKDEFLATVSHELRTPLSAVVSWSRVLQKKFEGGDAQLHRGLSIIVDNARLQAQIISDLLDMSRIVSGKVQLELVPADLEQLIENAVEGQRPSADAKRISLSIDSNGEPVIAEVDATRLQQVLWNLLSNAIKFTPEDGRVCIQMRRRTDWVDLIVRDTGIGIPADFLLHVFDRFRQAEGGKGRHFGGLGLGLAIVKQLVELHGGTVYASSDGEGRGSTFTVRLPTIEKHFEEHAAPHDDAEPVGIEALSGMRILAVEDDAAMLEVLARVLTEYGANVTGVSSG